MIRTSTPISLSIILFILILSKSFVSIAQTSISGIINDYYKVTAISPCGNEITLDNTTNLSVGDRVLIIQMKGAIIDVTNTASFGTILNLGNAGNYEFSNVASITGNDITFTNGLSRVYEPNNLVQLVRVPQYVNATVVNDLTAMAWNGDKGGILAFEVSGTLTLNDDIDVEGKGFRGGLKYQDPAGCTFYSNAYVCNSTQTCGGRKGEGIVIYNAAYERGRGPYANGGGGGNDHNAGGGGGGNYAAGGVGGNRVNSTFCQGPQGMGGKVLTYNNTVNKIFLGGGGGAGDDNNNQSSSGGNGGGIIIIKANTIVGNANKIEADGADAANSNSDGAGGGGGAGAILLDVVTFTGQIDIEAEGGYGGNTDNDYVSSSCVGPGGGGGGGLLWFSGTSLPLNVNTDFEGGDHGITTNNNGVSACPLGSANGAQDGALGGILYNLVLQESSGGGSTGPVANAGNAVTICNGGSTVLNGSGGGSYSWTPSGSLSNPTIFNPIATPNITTTYTLTVTDANGCTDTDTVTVTVTSGITANAGADVIICYGSSTTLSASGGTTYSWSPATGLSDPTIFNPVASPASTTTYTVTVSDGSGCSDTDEVIVTVNNLPITNAGQDVTICAGSSTTLSATGTGTFSWSPVTGLSAPNSSTTTANPSSTTTYTVTITDANGCVGSDDVVVTVNPLPIANIVTPPSTICPGNSITLNSSGGITYSWAPAGSLSDPNISNPVATPAATTTYTLTVTDANGCTDTETVTITVTSGVTANAGPDVAICNGSNTTLSASGGTTYSWSPTTGLSDPLISNPVASPTSTTTYTVTVSNGSGCSDTDVVIVTVNSLPLTNAGPDVSICAGSSTTLSATGTGTFSWSPVTGLSSPNSSSTTASPTSTTTYTVSITDANGCVGTDNVTVTVLAGVNASAGPDTTICTGNSVQLNATGGNGYSWSPATGLSNPNIPNPIATPLSTTIYTVTISSASCAPVTRTVSISVNPNPVAVARTDTTVCEGRSVPMSAGGGISYSWSPAAGLTNPNINNPIATPVATTTYTVTVTNAAGCKDTEDVIITVVPKPVVVTNNDTAICAGESVQMFADPGVGGSHTYSWSPANGLSNPNIANPVATPNLTTTYTVTVTNSTGCFSTKQVSITRNPIPVVVATSNTNKICAGDSVQLDVIGNGTIFSWSPASGLSNPNIKNPKASPASTTTYTITVSNNNGCFEMDNITITVDPAPVVNAGPDKSICSGGNVTLNGSATGTYSWAPSTGLSNPNILTPTASPAVTTTYTLTSTNAAGCTSKDSTTITVSNAIIANAGPDVTICNGSSTQLNAQGGTTYSWSPATGLSNPNISNPTASPAVTTTYTVTVSDGSTCTDTDVVTVTVTPSIVANVNSPAPMCIGDTTQLVASGGTVYSWAPATGLSDPNIANPKAFPASTTIYTVTVSSGSCTPNTATATVTVNPLPVADAGNDTTICTGTSAQLKASGGTTYNWSPASTLSANNINNPVANPTNTTVYTVIVTANGCSATDSIEVTVLPPMNVTASAQNDTICIGGSTILNTTSGSSYSWNPGTNLSDPTLQSPVASPSVSTIYTVTVTDAAGCSGTATVPVVVNPLPIISVSADDTICTGSSIQLTASGSGANYNWSPATSLSNAQISNPIADPATTTTYTVSAADNFGCINTDSVTITVVPSLITSISTDTAICEGGSIQLFATGGDDYEWIPATGLSNSSIADPIANPSATTVYQVIIKKGNCDPDTLDVTITVHPAPVVDAGKDTSVFEGTPIQLNANVSNTTSNTYQWNPDNNLDDGSIQSPVATVFELTAFTVTVTSPEGCEGTDEVVISIIINEQKQIFVPTGFSPNGDGINDEITPIPSEDITLKRFTVFNRWGKMVYEGTSGNFTWNGRYNGNDLPLGTYVFMIEYTTLDGTSHIKKGNITLLR